MTPAETPPPCPKCGGRMRKWQYPDGVTEMLVCTNPPCGTVRPLGWRGDKPAPAPVAEGMSEYLTFDGWWAAQQNPSTMDRAVVNGADLSLHLALELMKTSAKQAWDARQIEIDRAIAHDRQPYPTAHAYDMACKALKKTKENEGALWTLISDISDPIRKCFVHRTMPFAEFQAIAVKWQESISAEGHPDTLRSERDRREQERNFWIEKATEFELQRAALVERVGKLEKQIEELFPWQVHAKTLADALDVDPTGEARYVVAGIATAAENRVRRQKDAEIRQLEDALAAREAGEKVEG